MAISLQKQAKRYCCLEKEIFFSKPNSNRFGSKQINENGVFEVNGISLVSLYGMVARRLGGAFYVSHELSFVNEVQTQRGFELTVKGLPRQMSLHVDLPSKGSIIKEGEPIEHYSLIVSQDFEEEGLTKEEIRDVLDVWADHFKHAGVKFPRGFLKKKNQIARTQSEIDRLKVAQQIPNLTREEAEALKPWAEMHKKSQELIDEHESLID